MIPSFVSPADLGRLRAAFTTLLHPLEHPDPDAWRAAAVDTLRSLLECDGGLFRLDLDGLELHHTAGSPADEEGAISRLAGPYDAGDRDPGDATEHPAPRRYEYWGSGHSIVTANEVGAESHDADGRSAGFDIVALATEVREGRIPPGIHLSFAAPGPGRRFGNRELRLLELVHPAFEAGIRALYRFRTHREELVRIVDELRDGVLILDADGRLLHRNPTAARLLDAEGGKELLRTARKTAPSRAWMNGREGEIAPPRPLRTHSTPTARYELFAAPLQSGTFHQDPVTAVTIVRLDRQIPGPAEISERFGLTPRQAEVAHLLARRRTTGEIARALGISSHTVRRHIESILPRLGVHSRYTVRERLIRRGTGDAEGDSGEE